MAGVYTEETLTALNKNYIIDLLLKTQEQTNTTIASLTAEIKRLNENFQKLESDVSVVKNVNNILSKQTSSIERHVGKTPSIRSVNVLRWTNILNQQSVGCFSILVLA